MEQGIGLPGMLIEIGRAVSTDGGVVFVIRHVRRSDWFQRLWPSLRTAIAGHEGDRFGYAREEKRQRGLLALIAGLAMGYRSVKAIADVIEIDPLWRRTLGKRISQPDLSRLMELLARVGEKVLMGITKMGLKVCSYRGDAGMPSPELMSQLEQDGASYTLRLKSNPKLDKLAEHILTPGPWQSGRVFMGEFSYATKSWDRARRVLAKLQKPKTKDGAESLF